MTSHKGRRREGRRRSGERRRERRTTSVSQQSFREPAKGCSHQGRVYTAAEQPREIIVSRVCRPGIG